jgi:hypothetical protein
LGKPLNSRNLDRASRGSGATGTLVAEAIAGLLSRNDGDASVAGSGKERDMLKKALAVPAMVALTLAGVGANPSAAAVDQAGQITIPGTVVSSGGDQLIIRTDDHGHRMSFDVSPSATLPGGLRKGAHVTVTYHPLGPTGQAADEVRIVEGSASARGQSSFKVVTGPADVRVGAR